MIKVFFSNYKEALKAIEEKKNFYLSIEFNKEYYDILDEYSEPLDEKRRTATFLSDHLSDNYIFIDLEDTMHPVYDLISNCDSKEIIDKAYEILNEFYGNYITIRIHEYK
jgi:hypothetical protein